MTNAFLKLRYYAKADEDTCSVVLIKIIAVNSVYRLLNLYKFL